MRLSLIALSLTVHLLFLRPARGDETNQNVRELCRIEVAGMLMNAENDKVILQGQIAVGEQKIKDLRQVLLASEQEFQVLQQKAPSSIPAFDVDEQVVALRYRLQTLRFQLKEIEAMTAENHQRLAARQASYQELSSLTDPLFVWSRAIGTELAPHQTREPSSGAPRHLRYRHVCSQYQLLCPLPQSSVLAMQKLLPRLDHPIPCERYSQIR